MSHENRPQEIFKALSKVKRAIATSGVEKGGFNKDQGYSYRGIDDVMDAFATPLAENDVMALPSFSNLTMREGKTNAGKPYYFWDVECNITFMSLLDGSSVVVGPFFGEAGDTQDKGKTKVQSVAFRIGMLLTFTCPIGPAADPEADGNDYAASSHDAGGDALPKLDGGIEGLSPSQEKLLDAKLEAIGMTRDELVKKFGGIGPANFRAALESVSK